MAQLPGTVGVENHGAGGNPSPPRGRYGRGGRCGGANVDGPRIRGRSNAVNLVADTGLGDGRQHTRGGRHRLTMPGRLTTRLSRYRQMCTGARVWRKSPAITRKMADNDSLGVGARYGTTLARGGGGEGRRVSAPGGRADTHPAEAGYRPLYTRSRPKAQVLGAGFTSK
jgi:hypothetical protein